jgi:exodeoxyribonuclease V gamma subunit
VTLRIHRAERTDLLADELAGLLATPPADPFAEEVVVVPAMGVERWLGQRLSHRLGARPAGSGDGVCAGVSFRSPRSLVAEVLGTSEDDPWAPGSLVWPLLATLDDCLDEAWCAPVARHLGHFDTGDEAELRQGRRYAVAFRLARLFASYAVQRPLLLADWLAGRATDGRGGPLDQDLHWQPHLWRRLVERVEADPPHVRHETTLRRLREDPASIDLPSRVSLFGHTRIPSTEVELLEALASHRDVHLWLPHPSDALWRRLDGISGDGAVERAGDTSHQQADHPLLATLGRDVRELQRTLPAVDCVDQPGATVDDAPDTLLGWLQADLRGNRVDPDGRVLADDDRSIQVHACHGVARQVDVLREVLLGLLQDDPTLEPRDILVMCPDIETFAPLVVAGFGLGDVVEEGHPAHRMRVRLADRAPSRTNPLLGVAAQLLELAGGRVTASQVLDLAQAPPVRRRFGFTDDDLDTLTTWVRDAGVRWAFDREHRAPFGVDYPHNTWQFGLDRVLTGVAVSADARGWLGTTLPLDDVGSTRVELAGRFAEYVDRLRLVTDGLVGSRPLEEWLTTLGDGVTSLTAVDADDAWQSGQMQRELGGVVADSGVLAGTALRLADVRSLLSGHLAGRPTRANFRTGTLTVCTMVPMRSVPHRVVCLLGMDDGVYPRHGLADGDDVLARRPFTGERDVRSEDRQLMLDALLAATETVVVTYTGANEHTGQPRPPAVPLGELLDALDVTAGTPVRDRVVVHHPLQPFDVRNLAPGRLGVPGPFTFDRTALAAARAAGGPRPAPPEFLAEPLDGDTGGDVSLAELLAFFRDPVKGFFRALDVTLPWEVDGVADGISVELDHLEQWGVGDRMLRDMLAGIHPDDALQAEWRRGALPPGRLGWRAGQQIREQAMPLAISALTHRQLPARAIDVDVDLGQGRRLSGTVTDVYGDRLVAVGYSRLDGKHLLATWLRLLALAAHDDDRPWTGLTIGRPPRGSSAVNRLLGPVDHRATEFLRDLVAIHDEGRCRPVPIPLRTSYAFARAAVTGGNPSEEAERQWDPRRWDGENADPAHVRVWGERAPLSALTGLGDYARRVWQPLFEFEAGSV